MPHVCIGHVLVFVRVPKPDNSVVATTTASCPFSLDSGEKNVYMRTLEETAKIAEGRPRAYL